MSLPSHSQDFLKAATCAPDNGIVPRIPDGSGEHTFTQKFSRQLAISCEPNQVVCIVCTPTLPMACFSNTYPSTGTGMPLSGLGFYPGMETAPTLPTGGGVYNETKTEFPDWESVVSPSGINNTTNISAARLVSLSAELQCTTNAFNQYGTIQCFKTPLQLVATPSIASGGDLVDLTYHISGASALIPDAVSTGAYMAPVKDGAYVVSMNRNGGAGNFEFSNLIDNSYASTTLYSTIGSSVPTPPAKGTTPRTHFTPAPNAPPVAQLGWKGTPILWDNHFDSIVFKIINPSATAQTFILKNWISVEMATTYGSFLHGIAQAPPPRDPRAFKLYGAIQQNLPEAVPSRENPDFWKDVLGLAKSVSGVASMIPGPVGAIASGIHSVSEILSPESSSKSTKLRIGGMKIKLKKKKPKPPGYIKKKHRQQVSLVVFVCKHFSRRVFSLTLRFFVRNWCMSQIMYFVSIDVVFILEKQHSQTTLSS